MGTSLLIFDFDGVIADSEALANTVLAEVVTELGVPTTLEDAYTRYMGKRFTEVLAEIEKATGANLPEDFPDEIQSRTLARFRSELKAVPGARDYIERFAHIPKCIASSSSRDRLDVCLEVLGLQPAFGPGVFSASLVERGKPHPDIFLHAANEMQILPSRSIVIEDSVSGVEAGVAAGMTVIGLLAASHIPDGYGQHFLEAGAHHVAETFEDVAAITSDVLVQLPLG